MVRLKVVNGGLYKVDFTDFNSIVVRLKAFFFQAANGLDQNFNSIVVRLKVIIIHLNLEIE